MKKNLKEINKKVVLVFLYCIIACFSIAQTSSDDLQQQFIAYQTKNYNEKIFVHTDKAFYLAGESIWFKLYCVDENFHKPSDISKV
ncbi:MAG TPA: hypothetical protein VGG71_09520, partial [Chitinophagaceae bacterium]